MVDIIKAFVKFILITITLIVVVGIWGVFIEPRQLEVKKETLQISGWHKQHKFLKFAIIGDFHTGAPGVDIEQLKNIVNTTNNEKPDIILLLGDYVIQGVVGGNFVEPEMIAEELGKLKAPLGVIAILGNHDWWYDGNRVRKALEAAGITVLDNDYTRIIYKDQAFYIAGLPDLETQNPDVKGLISIVPDNSPVILLSHNPDVFPEVTDDVSLTLSGHTHGGQVILPFIGAPVVPSKYGNKYAKGHIVENNRHLFVTSGIGTSVFPIRLNNKPEIVIMTLEPAQ